ncbi:uncharacterized protein DS421_4g125100 [Arachis hypogaea]|nr:uncharacterized protein DS421_4g125100 [Arachis hypogaea]
MIHKDTCEGRKHYLLIAFDSELSSFAQVCVWTSTLLALPLLPSECNANDELRSAQKFAMLTLC